MSLQTFSWTDSVSKYNEGWPLYKLDRRAADRASLTLAKGAGETYASCMSPQGLILLEERWTRLASATTPEEVQAIYVDIRQKAEQIDYTPPAV